MDDELYEIFINNIKTKLQERVKGDVSVTKDDRHIFTTIYRFGYYWNFAVYNVSLRDVDELNSDIFVEAILGAYRRFINDSYFVI